MDKNLPPKPEGYKEKPAIQYERIGNARVPRKVVEEQNQPKIDDKAGAASQSTTRKETPQEYKLRYEANELKHAKWVARNEKRLAWEEKQAAIKRVEAEKQEHLDVLEGNINMAKREGKKVQLVFGYNVVKTMD